MLSLPKASSPQRKTPTGFPGKNVASSAGLAAERSSSPEKKIGARQLHTDLHGVELQQCHTETDVGVM
jgi:hypothetical protein